MPSKRPLTTEAVGGDIVEALRETSEDGQPLHRAVTLRVAEDMEKPAKEIVREAGWQTVTVRSHDDFNPGEWEVVATKGKKPE